MKKTFVSNILVYDYLLKNASAEYLHCMRIHSRQKGTGMKVTSVGSVKSVKNYSDAWELVTAIRRPA